MKFLRVKDFVKLGASALISKIYNSNTLNCFSAVYPEYDWLPWRLKHVPTGYWSSADNRKKFLDWAGKELKLNTLDDWYNVNKNVFVFIVFCVI